jgi:uncharacterized damage-inducible protein DinB
MPAELLKQQYELLKGSRQVLFAYCETISPEHYTHEIETFGHGSIRNLLVHVANSNIHWLPNFALGSLLPYIDARSILSMADVYPIYEQTNQFVYQFLDHFADSLTTELDHKLPTRGFNVTTTPLALFTHVLTHEVHHKGQVISMSRNLGYIPPDTDFIRF